MKMITNPIYKQLNKLKRENLYPFHMPGHKRNKKFLKHLKKFITLDFTELDQTDNLQNPSNIIKKSKQNMKDIFKCDESYFLVNGSTAGILASLLCILKPNDNILVDRNCHVSVFNALILCGAKPIYISPNIKYGFSLGIDEYLIKNVLKKHNIKACILTSPTYEGIVLNIKKIAYILHDKGVPLIVDEAHGAHFIMSKSFPVPALKSGADIAIQSFHKTLPAFTQCAAMHVKSDLINKEKLQKCLNIVQTTSPSYIFMLNIEYCYNFLIKNNYIKSYINNLNNLRAGLSKLKNFKLLDKNLLNNTFACDIDISRITLIIKKNISGSFINDLLIKQKIAIEMYQESYIIAISTICDTKKGLKRFLKAMQKIDKMLEGYEDRVFYKDDINIKNIYLPKESIRDIFYSKKIEIDIKYAENKICASIITAYPPGVCILAPGEIITKAAIKKIKSLQNNKIKILGLNKDKILIKA